MSFDFTSENIAGFLRDVAKEYRKLGGKNMPAEMILVGGAAVMVNYGFRNLTTDIDALTYAASSFEDAIRTVGAYHDLPAGWLNSDFARTSSYSEKLREVSIYYRSFYHVLTVRTVASEYLIAMKLRSGRPYKNDFSDIAGILQEEKERGNYISKDRIEAAFCELYGESGVMPETSREFLNRISELSDYRELYQETKRQENQSRNLLLEFQEKNPGQLKENSVNEILEELTNKLTDE